MTPCAEDGRPRQPEVQKPALISPGYEAQLRALHGSQGWGEGGWKFSPEVRFLAGKVSARSILDYGCGRGTLKRMLTGFDVREYDPGIAGKDDLPLPADLVVCTDVLEHIEPEKIDAVLSHIYELSLAACFVAVSLRPAEKRLPDGRNAHLIIDNAPWWMEKFRAQGWPAIRISRVDREELVVWLRK